MEVRMRQLGKFFLVLFIAVIFFGCAGSSSYMSPSAAPPTGPSAEKAMVYFMRPSGMGFAINFQIYHGDALIGLSQAKSYFTYECDPGTQMFLGAAENKHGLKAELEAGKSYFVLTQVKMGGWKARMAFVPVTRDSEWWPKVDEYKAKLNYIKAEQSALDAYRQAKKEKIDVSLDKSYSLLNSPEGQKYVVYLGPNDGR
jgi:hypothetical protein